MNFLDKIGLERFWEKIKAALRGKQDKLTGMTGHVVGFDALGDATAVEGWSNWNFVDNGGFDLWQNGTVLDASGLMYTADRWNNAWQKCRYERVDSPFSDCPCQYAIKITSSDNEGLWATVRQPIMSELAAALNGRTVTISAWVMGQSQAPLTLTAGNVTTGYTILLSTEPQRIVFTGIFDADTDSQELAIFSALNGNSDAQVGDWYIITGIKLELGNVATPYVPLGLPFEYALCNQYSPITGEWLGNQHSNPNLLDNWYFSDPVNQLKKIEYKMGGYGIDRWFFYAGESNLHTLVISDKNIQIISGENSNHPWIRQILEPFLDSEHMVTLSALVKVNNDGSRFALKVSNDDNLEEGKLNWFTLNASNSYHLYKFSFYPYKRSGVEIISDFKSNTILTIKAVKLEIGETQTLAHQDKNNDWVLNDPPPNKALELLKCQRYQYIANSIGNPVAVFGSGVAFDTKKCTITIPIPNLRIFPVIKSTGNLTVYSPKTLDIPENHIQVIDIVPHRNGVSGELAIDITTNKDLVVGNYYFLCAENDINARLIFDSNL